MNVLNTFIIFDHKSTALKKSSPSASAERLPAFESEVMVASPGRINLIGEHTDYNYGFVLPTAIDSKIYFEFRKNNTPGSCKVYSEDFSALLSFELEKFAKSARSWENYILGVVDQIQKRGKSLRGFDCTFKSELPIGAGISSSAALECGIASGLNALFSLGLTKQEIVELSQAAENDFVGSNCGIMDQFASVKSKKDHLILLDCRSLEAEYIPADFQDCKLLLLNTNVSHNLAEGEYNTRRQECEQAVQSLRKIYASVNSLRDVDMGMLEESKQYLSPKTYQRSTYVVRENERVLKAANAIREGDLSEFGALMYASHQGLQHDYEVSCPQLDFLVDYSRDKDFILGARMMGGGFGGCTINLIKEHAIKDFVQEVSAAYRKEFDIRLDAITVFPSEGTVITKK